MCKNTKYRISFIIHIKEGKTEEYKIRHKNISQDMKNMLKEAGIFNYTIWLHNNMVFGYYETNDITFTKEFKSKSKVQHQWDTYMSDIFKTDSDGERTIIYPEQVFLLE